MKFSSDEVHIWMQHALCLEASGQHARAFSMMKRVSRLMKNETQPKLIAARIAYQTLNKVNQFRNYSEAFTFSAFILSSVLHVLNKFLTD